MIFEQKHADLGLYNSQSYEIWYAQSSNSYATPTNLINF